MLQDTLHRSCFNNIKGKRMSSANLPVFHSLFYRRIFLALMLLAFFLCAQAETDLQPLALNKLRLPAGFSISVYARVKNARSMTLGKNSIVYVGSRAAGNVYAIIPNKTRSHAKQVIVIGEKMEQPNGVAYHNGNLYVAEISRLWRYKNIDQHLFNSPPKQLVYDKLPTKTHHGWRYIKFSPDDWLYISIGAPCNVCVSSDPQFGTLSRMKPNGDDFQIFAKGIRNSVGFDWDSNNKLWFTDNGRDWLGDNLPPDELNYAPHQGMNFGFPYFYGDNVPDPSFSTVHSSKGMTVPALKLGPHVAALGMTFYKGAMFPNSYQNQIIIAEHGSWNRSKKIGYRLMLVKLRNHKAIARQPFVTGWLQGQNAWGRPVDTLVMPDGSLLVSDDFSGTIYRITYHAPKK